MYWRKAPDARRAPSELAGQLAEQRALAEVAAGPGDLVLQHLAV